MAVFTEDYISQALPGAADHGNNIITFALFAPAKKSVRILSSFNGWDIKGEPLENRGDDLWVLVKELPTGVIEYQYLIDDSLVICDPYALQIRFDQSNPSVPRAVFHIGKPPFEWKHDDWQRPLLQDLIIYEMHVGDFTPAGNYQEVEARLGYLKDLGINAIEFMPLNEAGPNDYWGYQPTYFFAPRMSYGTPDDLKHLVDTAHVMGIACILDMVLVHTDKEHPYFKMYPYEQSPWYGQNIGEKDRYGLPMLDYTKNPTNSYLRDIQAYWMRDFHMDGFRYDYLIGLGATEKGQGLPYLIQKAKEINPDIFLIGECSPENPQLINDSEVTAAWHIRVVRALEALLQEEDRENYQWSHFAEAIKVFDPATQEYSSPQSIINFAESHDEERLGRMLQAHNFPADVITAKSALTAALLMTAPGEPMIYMGQEWGESTEKKLQPNKINWNALNETNGKLLWNHYSMLARLRKERNSIRNGDFEFLIIDEERHVVAFKRSRGEIDIIVVALNFSKDTVQLQLPMPQDGRWHERIEDSIFEINNKNIALQIPGYGYRVLCRKGA